MPFKRILHCNLAANSLPTAPQVLRKAKFERFLLIFVALGTLRIELSPARELDSQVFAMLPFKTFPKLPKCVRKTSQERFGKLLGALWGSPGRSWGALGALLGSSWAQKLVKKIEKAQKIAEKMSKSAKQLPLDQLERSWAHFLSSWPELWPSRMQI